MRGGKTHREIYRLAALEFDGVQIVLDVQSLEKIENLLIYDFHFSLGLFSNVHFYSLRGLDVIVFFLVLS